MRQTPAKYSPGGDPSGALSPFRSNPLRSRKLPDPETTEPCHEVAIIGMSGRFPGAGDLAEYWRNLSEGVESIVFFSDQELLDQGVPEEVLQRQDYVKAGSILTDIDLFDAPFFGINPREAEGMDPQHRLFLECAWHALEDAGYAPEAFEGSIGVYAGCARSTYWDYLNRFPDFINKLGFLQIMLGNEKDYLTTRASYKLNLKGPSVCVQASCATSLVAVNQACQALLTGQCDMALAGGICVRVPQKAPYHYQPGGIFSPDGHCRVFDADAQGMIFGNGVGLVVLRPLADALKAGDPIRAVIKGSIVTNDGSAKGSYTAPSVEGQAAAVARALKLAGVQPDTITYVEAHGTGTTVGDPVEVAALTRAFRQGTDRVGFCALGSVKSNFGHLDHAAGIAGLIKTVLALEHRQIPPTLHFQRPNPEIAFEQSPFAVTTDLTEWKSAKSPLRAGVSAFSIGGTNAHVVLEEAPAAEPSGKSRPSQLLAVSARTAAALDTATAQLADHLERHPYLDLADVAYTCHVGRRTFAHRRFILAQDLREAARRLRADDPELVATGSAPATEPAVAFLFSGQGSQYIRMAHDLFRVEPVFREQLETCIDILRPRLGLDLRRLLYPPPVQAEEAAVKLRQTAITQAALFSIEYALAKLLLSWGIRPAAMIGHSLGEYVAACLAGVFSLETALALVAERGRLMQALPPGSMLAVNLPETDLASILGVPGGDAVSLAAINEATQCVVSGPTEAIDHLEAQLLRSGVSCRRLQTSHAFHSSMMQPMLESYRAFLADFDFQAPQIPYISNVTGTWAAPEVVTDPAYWTDHIRRPVRFAEGLGCLLRGDCRILLEVGPGQTLCSFARRHPDKTPAHRVFSSLRARHERKADTEFLQRTVGRLWLAGVNVDWPSFYAYERRRRVRLPGYPFERQRYWVDPPRPASALASPEKKPDLADWFYVPTWTEDAADAPSAPALPDEQGSTWLVFQDELGVGADLASRLESAGRNVVVVRPGPDFTRLGPQAYQIDPRQREHYLALVGDLCGGPGVPSHIAHLWSLSTKDEGPGTRDQGPTPGAMEEALDLGFYSLLYTAQALVSHNVTDSVRIGVISNQVHRVRDGDTVCPAKAIVLGARTVISQEYPNLRCHSIDLGALAVAEAGPEVVDRLLAELEGALPGTVAAYRDGQRLRPSFAPLRLEKLAAPGPLLRPSGVYLITGGMGRIGLALAKGLAASLQARLVLVGRSRLPEREGWAEWLASHPEDDPVSRKIRSLQEIEELGGQVLALTADISSLEQMQGVLDRTLAQFGALHGVIHGAGTVSAGDFLGVDQVDRVACDRHFRPKMQGALVLRQLLRDRDCDFCLLVSSLSTVLGGLGYLAYTSANAFLDALAAQADRAGGTRWYGINWDQWSFPDAPADALAILPDEGVETFMRFLDTPPANQVVVSTYDLHYRIKLWVDHVRGADSDAEGAGLHARPELATDYAAPRDSVEQAIAKLFEETLGIHNVGIYDRFFELGGQSLLATELVAKVRAAFRIELPLRQFFEAPTVADLAQAVARSAGEAEAPAPTEALAEPSENGLAAGEGPAVVGLNGSSFQA
jgi:acyl transferase domain-containing protein/acyl carrier protein